MALTFNLSLLAVVLCREREFSNVLRALCFVKSTNLRIYLFRDLNSQGKVYQITVDACVK